jgi:hypothetical protein
LPVTGGELVGLAHVDEHGTVGDLLANNARIDLVDPALDLA